MFFKRNKRRKGRQPPTAAEAAEALRKILDNAVELADAFLEAIEGAPFTADELRRIEQQTIDDSVAKLRPHLTPATKGGKQLAAEIDIEQKYRDAFAARLRAASVGEII